jgi:hypothetical protein
MKRSEMLKDILWWLNDQLYTVDDSGEGDIHPQCADDLLAMIEKVGMLPPGKLIVPKGSECRKWQTNIEFYTTCKWEEE